MRITFIMPSYVWVPSGSHRVVYEYANQLSQRGHEIILVFPNQSSQPTVHDLKGYLRRQITKIRKITSRLDPTWFPLDKRIRHLSVPKPSNRYIPEGDVVIATQWFIAEYLHTYEARKGVPFYLIHHHEAASGAPRERVDATWRLPYHKFAVSRWTCEQGQQMGVNDMTYIPNGIDHQLYRLTSPILNRSKRIAMAYVNKSSKDPQTGIRALIIAKQRFPDLEAVLFGVGRQPDNLPIWIKYYRNKPNHFLVEEIYNSSAVFLCSSRVEGFGFTLAEAMACGCAAVSTDCGGVRDFAEHGVTALLSQPGDANVLARHLCFLLEQQEERLRLAEAGRQRIAQFTWDKSADELNRLMIFATTKSQVGAEACYISERSYIHDPSH